MGLMGPLGRKLRDPNQHQAAQLSRRFRRGCRNWSAQRVEDDEGGTGMAKAMNVLGGELETCSTSPMTGFFRNGCCDTGREDQGLHVVCIQATRDFLEFSRWAGNDLSTPNPMYDFPGVKPGDRWCLCA